MPAVTAPATPPVSAPGAAPVGATATAAAVAAKPDDLKRIRAVDAVTETALNRMGVRRYSEIADWKTDDVGRISRELGFNARIEQENWIEQAQILARGEDTFFSRRLARGEMPSARPVADEGERIVAAPVVEPSAPIPARSRSGVEAAAAAAAAMAAAASRAQSTPVAAAAPARASQTAASPAPAAPAAPVAVAAATMPAAAPAPASQATSPALVSDRAAFAATSAAPVSAIAPAPAAPVSDAPQLAQNQPAQNQLGQNQASAATKPAIGTTRDNLQRIGGINAEVEKLLNVQGVNRYAQIAHWGKPESERFDRLLGFQGRIQRENWIEQSQILAKGGDTAYSREFDRRTAEALAKSGDQAAARPTRLADAIRSNDQAATETRPRSNDLSNLRSVRSDAFRQPESSQSRTDAATGIGASRSVRSTVPDDLKRVRGIGVLIEKKLNSMGITGYEQIASWQANDIERVSQVLDFKGRIERENWVEQARILAAGGQTEFSRRADRGDIDPGR